MAERDSPPLGQQGRKDEQRQSAARDQGPSAGEQDEVYNLPTPGGVGNPTLQDMSGNADTDEAASRTQDEQVDLCDETFERHIGFAFNWSMVGCLLIGGLSLFAGIAVYLVAYTLMLLGAKRGLEAIWNRAPGPQRRDASRNRLEAETWALRVAVMFIGFLTILTFMMLFPERRGEPVFVMWPLMVGGLFGCLDALLIHGLPWRRVRSVLWRGLWGERGTPAEAAKAARDE